MDSELATLIHLYFEKFGSQNWNFERIWDTLWERNFSLIRKKYFFWPFLKIKYSNRYYFYHFTFSGHVFFTIFFLSNFLLNSVCTCISGWKCEKLLMIYLQFNADECWQFLLSIFDFTNFFMLYIFHRIATSKLHC